MTAPPTPGAVQPVVHPDVAALGELLLRLQRRRSSAIEGARLELSAFRLLWQLSDGRARTLRELADALELEQSTVNRQVHAALDAGWLERSDAADGPARLLQPTDAGAAAYAHDLTLRAGLIGAALGELGPARSQRLIADLAAFLDAWDAAREPRTRDDAADRDRSAASG